MLTTIYLFGFMRACDIFFGAKISNSKIIVSVLHDRKQDCIAEFKLRLFNLEQTIIQFQQHFKQSQESCGLDCSLAMLFSLASLTKSLRASPKFVYRSLYSFILFAYSFMVLFSISVSSCMLSVKDLSTANNLNSRAALPFRSFGISRMCWLPLSNVTR